MRHTLLRSLTIGLFLGFSFSVSGFNGPVRFSDAFYAAQKFFYNEARAKYPKIGSEKGFPEIPIRGSATNEELKKIEALTDFFEARRVFLRETGIYAEQIYPEIFSFLNAHPALSVGPSNKQKFAAMEKYFYPFFYVFSQDKHYGFNSVIRTNPCPIVFCLKDEKKNNLGFNVYNTSKKNFEFNISESPGLAFISVTSKRPMPVKAGSTGAVKFTVDVQKLKKDSTFKVVNLVLSDPTQPKLKVIVPVILLPSKDFLNLPAHCYDLSYSYSTFFKHIALQKEKTSWPEKCPSGDCSGNRSYSLRSNDRHYSSYGFGDLCNIQYNLSSQTSPLYNVKNNTFKFVYNEIGTIEGMDRNCPGSEPGSETYCPPDAPNNGKELYGTRKTECKAFLPPGKTYDLKINVLFNDLANQSYPNTEVSWLGEKKLVVVITDNNDKLVSKNIVNRSPFHIEQKGLSPGTYNVAVFPFTEDGKLTPSFNLQHLNNGNRARFDFTMGVNVEIIGHNLPAKK
ncbi:MAG: hypothetical protein JNL60_18700 [Bacteroidia bacterium]|nr:hypothetical protein [Bacteroidia bacterium]